MTCWVSFSKLEKPSVPKKPFAGSVWWQPLQVCTVSEVTLKKKSLPACWSGVRVVCVVGSSSNKRFGLGG